MITIRHHSIRGQCRSLRVRCAVALAAALVAACAHDKPTHPLTALDESIRPAPKPYSHTAAMKQRNGQVGDSSPGRSKFEGTEEEGSGNFVSERVMRDLARPERTARGGDGITLNLVNVPIAQAAKSILGDILKANYTVADKVAGAITIQTSSPMSRDALVDVFESALKVNGAALVRADGHYKIVPAQGAVQTGARLARGVGRGEAGPGLQLQVVPLAYAGASEMRRILEPIVPAGAIVSIDDSRGFIVIAGNSRELGDILQLVQLFDVDWMKGMSVGVFPTQASDPEALAREVDAVMGLDRDGPLKGQVRIIPNRRLAAVMVIAHKPQQLETARKWLHNLDKAAARTEDQLFVYKVKNRVASELAVVLTRMLGTRDGGNVQSAGSTVAPRFDPVVTSSITPADPQAGLGARAVGSLSSAGTATPAPTPAGPGNLLLAPQPAVPPPPAATSTPAPAPPISEPAAGLFQGRTAKIVADESNNTLLITATRQDYERISKILTRLDVQPTQVMLEALIAEVTLNDDLKFGVKWSQATNRNSITLSDRSDGSIASNFPGFSYFFQSRNFAAAIDALQEITKVKVMSAPSLMVLDNRRATLQVGDQVPILTQSAVNPLIGNGTAVNTIAQRDTGIILNVQPRVSDSGRVTLDIEQEVSNVVETSSSTINSPTFQQRRIRTTVVVSDGEVIALGGLIQERDTVNKSQIPLLGQIPILGSAFRQKGDKIDRTELMVFLRPTVVRDASEARDVTEEFRHRLSIGTPTTLIGRDKLERDKHRMLR